MFERLQKPFLTVETGEAYQPIRLTYTIVQRDSLVARLNTLQCCEKKTSDDVWHWLWRGECETVHFESITSFQKHANHPTRLGSITVNKNNTLCISLPSFKRACLGVSFFYQTLGQELATIHHADFINKVFGVDERLPHGFAELFKENELEAIIQQRITDYHKVKEKCEHAASAQEALALLAQYTKSETEKRLPYAERYVFQASSDQPIDASFLSFYIFLRSRELVAIRRWFGEAGYTLANAADETIEQVFGNMDIDIIE